MLTHLGNPLIQKAWLWTPYIHFVFRTKTVRLRIRFSFFLFASIFNSPKFLVNIHTLVVMHVHAHNGLLLKYCKSTWPESQCWPLSAPRIEMVNQFFTVFVTFFRNFFAAVHRTYYRTTWLSNYTPQAWLFREHEFSYDTFSFEIDVTMNRI